MTTKSKEETHLVYIGSSGRRFIRSNADDIYLSGNPLRQHLNKVGDKTSLVVSQLLDEQDWTVFEANYASSGRPPYAPRCMVGLILYSILHGMNSLRSMERMGRMDLGCLWVTGGIFPDHANIGRFINRHNTVLTTHFFEALTRAVIQRTGSSSRSLAGDGTLVEAACSNYNLIKEEAAQAALQKTKDQLKKTPDDKQLQATLAKQSEVHATLLERKSKQKRRGKKDTSASRISPTEPEAARHKMKRGRGYAQAYVPSVLADDKRVVLGVAVDPTNEAQVIPQMLDQAERIMSKQPQELLVDGGYFTDSVIEDSLARDISLLCPEGGQPGQPKKNQRHHKSRFRYEAVDDVYICPAGQRLPLIWQPKDPNKPRAQWVYGGAPCQDCPLRTRCTKAKNGRKIRRFANDMMKDELRRVMEHPAAKKAYRKRQGMVEPVFGYLRTVQGLSRFRRRGLQAVKLEFTLHILAYNLSRAVALALLTCMMMFTKKWTAIHHQCALAVSLLLSDAAIE